MQVSSSLQQLAPSQVPVAHTCNPSYSGGRDQEDHGWKPPGQIVFETLTQRKKKKNHHHHHQKSWWNGSRCRPECKAQYHQKKKKSWDRRIAWTQFKAAWATQSPVSKTKPKIKKHYVEKPAETRSTWAQSHGFPMLAHPKCQSSVSLHNCAMSRRSLY
jgi:hypothetical protein